VGRRAPLPLPFCTSAAFVSPILTLFTLTNACSPHDALSLVIEVHNQSRLRTMAALDSGVMPFCLPHRLTGLIQSDTYCVLSLSLNVTGLPIRCFVPLEASWRAACTVTANLPADALAAVRAHTREPFTQ
jgi:hypothetical protein